MYNTGPFFLFLAVVPCTRTGCVSAAGSGGVHERRCDAPPTILWDIYLGAGWAMTGSLGLVYLGRRLNHIDKSNPIMTAQSKEKKRKSEEPKSHRVRRAAP